MKNGIRGKKVRGEIRGGWDGCWVAELEGSRCSPCVFFYDILRNCNEFSEWISIDNEEWKRGRVQTELSKAAQLYSIFTMQLDLFQILSFASPARSDLHSPVSSFLSVLRLKQLQCRQSFEEPSVLILGQKLEVVVVVAAIDLDLDSQKLTLVDFDCCCCCYDHQPWLTIEVIEEE